ncbi:serine/threonine protein kinase [Dictyobacter aurantiacus]|uniref:non-specific serine/threonine protein kinase n=1 Tax=Dictyobacter aurantiacus TaxID=1936993 RepID=A0A401ZDG9_9CHLR|nr:serine/threonine-protein kinase [Dictyobacter aurantiacus]GCE04930.1 hypothetical protein KDAU_22590 [Dictyobacter aurantiacus]
MEDRTGQQLGNYKILRQVGQGGFADVYLAEHIHLRTQAAIKILQVRLGENNKQNFLNEARTIAHLVHPYIIRVLDFGIQDNTPFLVMDYAPNGTFRQRFLQGRPLPAAPLVPYIKQTAAALQYGHDKKLIHRDVKPENMLLSHNDEVLLSDFGLALIAYNSNSRSPTETAGTAAYMAPEQLQGKPKPASDQYALGIIAYEWVTGDCPFHGSFFEIASQQVLAPPPPMRDKAPQTPLEIEKVIMRALEKDPQKRFPTVRDFALSLEEACLSSKQYTFKMPFQTGNSGRSSDKYIYANSQSHPSNENNYASPGETIRNSTNETVASDTRYTGGLGQAPAAISQSERLRPPLPPTDFANTPPITPHQFNSGTRNSFSNMRSVPERSLSQGNLPTFPGPGPVSQQNLPVFPADPPLFPSERSPRGQVPPLGARPISQANPALMAALQQSMNSSGSHAAEKIPETPGSISGPRSAPLAGPTAQQQPPDVAWSTRDAHQIARARDEQIAAKFAFKTNDDDEPVANRKPVWESPQNRLVIILVALLIILGGVGISLFASNSVVQQDTQQQNATEAPSTTNGGQSAAAAKATQTARIKQATTNPYDTNGTGSLVLNDPLTSNHHTWQEGADSTAITAGTCAFTNQGYRIIAPALEPTMCFENKDTYSNFTYQVDMKFVAIGQRFSGAGIVFRGNVSTKEYYFFEIYASGNYTLQKCTAAAGCANPIDGYKLGKPALTSFKSGLNIKNTLAVVANGDTFTLFVNQQKVSTITDQISAPFTSGHIGVLATGGNDTGVDSPTNTATNVIFSQAKVWR